jgi:hypothetical protein
MNAKGLPALELAALGLARETGVSAILDRTETTMTGGRALRVCSELIRHGALASRRLRQARPGLAATGSPDADAQVGGDLRIPAELMVVSRRLLLVFRW